MNFQLIVITAPDTSANEVKYIHQFFDAGLKTLHIRKPGYTKDQLRNFIARIEKKYHKRLVLHSHYDLASEFRIKGIHLTEITRKKTLPRAYDAKKHTISASFHFLNHISLSRRDYSYVFLSPVYDSISKRGYKSQFEAAELKQFLARHNNIVALGGVSKATIKNIIDAGFAGAATLGYIWESRKPVETFKKLLLKIQ